MNLFKNLFYKNKQNQNYNFSMNEIIEIMYDKNLNFSMNEIIEIMYDKNLNFSDEIIQVLYSNDKSKRYVILKSENGIYKFRYEEIIPLDEYEIMLKCNEPDFLPAYWCEVGKNCSFYITLEETLKGIFNEPNYKTYFTKHTNEK